MKRLILITLLAFGFATANAQYYQLRYDSVRVVSKFKLGNVSTGASTDSILTKKANGGVYKIAQSSFATPIFQRSSGNITPITSGDRISITTSSGTTAITAVSSSGTGNALYAQAADYNAISAINTSSSYAPINVLNNGSGALASFSNGTLGEVTTVNNNGTITAPLLGYTKRLTANGTGAATTISIPHGLTGITGTSSVVASANSSAAGGYNYVDVDTTNVNFYYTVAPISGTNNLIYSVTIK